MKVNQNSDYFQIPLPSLDQELKNWVCKFSKQTWYYHDQSSILVETSLVDGIIFRLKFAEKMFG